MTAARRLLVLLALTVVAVLGAGSTAANATFSISAALPGMTVSTATIQAVTQLEVKRRSTTTTAPEAGTGTVQAKVEWWRSTSRGVTGYVVTAHLTNGAPQVVARTDATADEVFLTFDAPNLRYEIRFTVTTLTEYG